MCVWKIKRFSKYRVCPRVYIAGRNPIRRTSNRMVFGYTIELVCKFIWPDMQILVSFCVFICVLKPFVIRCMCQIDIILLHPQYMRIWHIVTVIFVKSALKTVQYFSYTIQCHNCFANYHKSCINMKRHWSIPATWYCLLCVQSIFPYNHIDGDDDFQSAIFECISDCAFSLHEINKK